jgi:hypothetical protein
MSTSAMALALCGPSTLFGFPEHIIIVMIGMFILGFVQAPNFVNSVPEVMESFQLDNKLIEGYDK